MNEILENFNDQSAQSSFDPGDVQKNKILVAICYVFPILFFLPIVVDGNSSYCRFHANQQLAWLIFGIVLSAVSFILSLIPVLGVILDILLSLCGLAVLIGLIYGAVKGMAVRLPFIGNLLSVF